MEMPNNNTNTRPVFLDLTRIHQPVNAILSIAHRITGVIMVLSIPVLIFLFDRSLAGEEGYDEVTGLLGSPVVRIGLIALTWVLSLHLFAGIRFLLFDAAVGTGIRRAKASAQIVFIAGALVTVLAAVALL
jgi:succinate dehydrogenase / fumarate reductase cytochrome b subunit